MDRNHPNADKTPFRDRVKRAISSPTLWAVLLIAGSLIAATLLLRRDDELDTENDTDQAFAETFSNIPSDSPWLQFGPEDISVTHKWSLLAGTHPAVTFHCHFTPPNHDHWRAVLCYKPLNSSSWMTEEARIRRDNTSTAHLTLRDLHRNTTYECFFILSGKEIMVRSQVVAFSTQ